MEKEALIDTSRSIDSDKNVLPSRKATEAYLASMQLHQLRDYYRQGWKPDWKDDSYKYCIFWKRNNYAIARFLYIGFFLSFQTKKLPRNFLKTFVI